MNLTCREFVDFLNAYIDGDLPADQAQVFDKHMGLCPPCVHYLQTYKRAAELPGKCAELDRAEPPEDVPEALVKAILAARRKG